MGAGDFFVDARQENRNKGLDPRREGRGLLAKAELFDPMKRLRLGSPAFALLLLGLSLAGCVSAPPPIPPELQYQPPAAGANTATLVGSQEHSSWADDFTAFVSGVDGKRVMLERKGWNTPLVLAAGPRTLTAEFRRGAFNTRAEVSFVAEGGHAYRLRFASDVGFNGRNSYCDFWVEDIQTTKPASGIVRGSISSSSNDVFIPIFIPAK